MSADLEAELDDLFQLPPAEMVAARNELVARLKKAGEREAAARVKGLKRPAPAAWALNQVFFRERALLEAALSDVAQVRELQATDGLDRQQLAAAVSVQRVTQQAIVDAALRYCTGAGLATGSIQERRIFATVQAWLSGSGAEAPGRMTEELEPSGFGGLGQLGMPSPLPAAARTPTPSTQAPSASAPSTRAPSASAPGTQAPNASAARTPASSASAPSASAPPIAKHSAPSAPAAPQPLQRKAAEHPGQASNVVPAEELARRARERAEALVREHKQAAAWAQERLHEKRDKLSVAEQAVERARRELEDAERALADRRSRLHEKEAEHTRRHADVEDAERAQRAAEEALTKSRAELAKL